MRRLRRFSRRMSMKNVRTTTMPKLASKPRTLSTDSRGNEGASTISTGMGRCLDGIGERATAGDEPSGCGGGAARSLLISFMVSEALLSATFLDQWSESIFSLILDL